MGSGEAILWVAAGAAGLALLGFALNRARHAAARRARLLRHRRAFEEEQTRRRARQQADAARSMLVERAAAIRREAEAAALRVARGNAPEALNPYREGSSEFVLWIATYHLALANLADEGQQPASREGARTPPLQPGDAPDTPPS